MCLYKTHKWPKIAWKPIKVYKVLNIFGIFTGGTLVTPCTHKPVEFNKPIKAAKHWIHGINKNNIEAEGVHAYLDKYSASKMSYYVMFEAIIPRFSLYWLGRKGDIAATKMIVKRKL